MQAKRKRKNMAGLKIVVAGCVAQQEGEALLRRVPEVDLVMGPQYANRCVFLPPLMFRTLSSPLIAVRIITVSTSIANFIGILFKLFLQYLPMATDALIYLITAVCRNCRVTYIWSWKTLPNNPSATCNAAPKMCRPLGPYWQRRDPVRETTP